MKTAIVIPTLNAVKRGKWRELLDAVSRQTASIARKIIVDSSSDDTTCAIADSFGWECRTIKRKDFNHGTTRDKILRGLASEGIDTVIFLSQDAVPATPDSLKNLVDFLWSHPVSGCYGRQISRKKNSLDGWQRAQLYPQTSAVKTQTDIPQEGMKALFFSNAFAAWKTSEVIRYGGFPETEFGEDILLSARILDRGGAAGYCAEAVVVHEHPDTVSWLFLRGMKTGSLHRKHPELLRKFCSGKQSFPFSSVPFRLWLQFLIKAAGYLSGRFFALFG